MADVAFTQLDPPEADAIEPVAIRHEVDEGWEGGRLHFRYNYLVYRFVAAGAEMSARAYLDTPSEVALYGPSCLTDGTGPLTATDAPELRQAVIRYLSRRFQVILELGGERGYRPIWMVARPKGVSRDEPWPPHWRGDGEDDPPAAPPPPCRAPEED